MAIPLGACPADWADIALTLADRYGPPSEVDFEEQFSTLSSKHTGA
jgi:hypothetical protein